MQPALLPRNLYMLGACVRTTVQSVRQIAAPALGGFLVSRYGFETAVQVAASCYVLSGVATAMIRTPGRPEARSAKVGLVEEALAGWRTIRESPPVRFVVTFQSLVVFTMAMQAPLVYVFVREVLGRGPEMTGTLFSAAGIGGIAGGVAMARWGDRVRDRLGLAMLTLAFDGLVLLLFTFSRTPWQAAALFSLFGVIGAVNGVVYQTVLQEEVPDAVRGRVQGGLVMLYRSVEVASVALGTLVADRTGVVPVFVLCALAEVAVALAARRLPSYRAARAAESAPRAAAVDLAVSPA
jgi:predicted MFS family arabinose efflux permease